MTQRMSESNKQRFVGPRGYLLPNEIGRTDIRDAMRLVIYHCIACCAGDQPSDVKLYARLLARALFHAHPQFEEIRDQLELHLEIDLSLVDAVPPREE